MNHSKTDVIKKNSLTLPWLEVAPPQAIIYRRHLQEYRQELSDRLFAGDHVDQLITALSDRVDQILQHLWDYFIGKRFDDISLIAVGGYGRGELHPYSDIDLLILHQNPLIPTLEEQLQLLLTFLWDVGLDIGHSVRDFPTTVGMAADDITIATNLMESRLIAGNYVIFQQMRQLTGPDEIWESRRFYSAKLEEQRKRHKKFNNTAYNLEPNIKEGPGGLRDIQNIGWVAKREFGANSLHDLVTHNFLTTEEYNILRKGELFLWKIRFALHLLAGRHEDRLLFDHQRALAEQFGYRDNRSGRGIEQFMKAYYRTITELERLNDLLLQIYDDEILNTDHSSKAELLNKRFQIRNGYLEMTHPKTFKNYPFSLLEIFLLLAQHPEVNGIRAGTLREIRAHLSLIDTSFRQQLSTRTLFIEILRQSVGVTRVFRLMNRYGVLAAYLPEFGKIVGLMQYDLFHTYTVDEHTLRVMRNLRRFAVDSYRGELPLCSDIMEQIPKPELLYITAIFHDIAKGRGGDHSKLGAVDANAFCVNHHLGNYDTFLICWLVENHLLMSLTAQRKDISDPEVINHFANLVGEQQFLDYLFLFTVADIRATSPNVWNSWKATLLTELYRSCSNAFSRGLAYPLQQQELVALSRHDAERDLVQHGFTLDEIHHLWDLLGSDYLQRYRSDEIVWHCNELLKRESVDKTMVITRQIQGRELREVFIYTPVSEGLFRNLTARIDRLGLNVVNARILSNKRNFAIDSYSVLERTPPKEQTILERSLFIENSLLELLQQEQKNITNSSRSHSIPRQVKHFKTPTQVIFHKDTEREKTILEVVTRDQPGLLSRLATAISLCPVILHHARITTLGERVEDLFFISNKDGSTIEKPSLQQQIQDAVMQELTNDED